MNLRELVRGESVVGSPYYKLNREERHLAAILFHLLNQQSPSGEWEYLERVLKAFDCNWEIDHEQFGIYFEYSYPRDLWYHIGREGTDGNYDKNTANERKRNIILKLLAQFECLDAAEIFNLNRKSIKEFNSFFIDEPRASANYIESPANWNVEVFARNIPQSEFLASTCKLKWAFRSKPDIVIHTDNDHAICLELKLESIESGYPAAGSEKVILTSHGLYGSKGKFTFPMHETALQRFLMARLLGIESQCWLITRGKPAKLQPEIQHLSWTDLIRALDPLPANLPRYMQQALEHARHGLVISSGETEHQPN